MRVSAEFRQSPWVPLRYARDAGRWVVIRGLSVSLRVPTFAGVVTVPQGRHTDGASVPRLLWALIGHPLSGNVYPAALVHDELYLRAITTRREADAVFYHLLTQLLPASAWARVRCYSYWAGVRVGGWVGWRHHRQRQRESHAER